MEIVILTLRFFSILNDDIIIEFERVIENIDLV